MSLKSVYLPVGPIENDLIRITSEEHRHLAVARAEVDELLEVFDGKGNVWTASVVATNRRETVARLLDRRRVEPDRIELILAQALIRTTAFEQVVEKAVEVGVTRIIPFIAARSNVAVPGRQDRWMRIIVEAAKQSKRYYLPVLDDPVRFNDLLSLSAASKILFAEREGGPLKSALSGSPVLYVIGPEGGFTDAELTAARQHGFGLVSLGTGILRSETAAIVGGSLIRYEHSSHERFRK